MKISVIICSFKRPQSLHDTVMSLTRQTHPPLEILIACCSRDHVTAATLAIPGVRRIESRCGLTVQRNAGLDALSPHSELIAFLDDDMELCPSYFRQMCRLFTERPGLVVASGHMLRDGGRGRAVDRQEAIAVCAAAEQTLGRWEAALATRSLHYGYGCNMLVRASAGRGERFDEQLSLYAWLEDSDFSHRCRVGKEPPVIHSGACGVHLGIRSGRMSGLKMGFSQIMNPIYLWRKARVFTLRHLLIQYWARCMVANLLGIFWGDPEEERLRRLRGNGIALWHLLTGRCDPRYIEELP